MTDFVSIFRNSAPYIHAYRGKTAVVWLRGKVLSRSSVHALVSDLALLNSLGLKLIVLFDADDQVEDVRLNENAVIDPNTMDTILNRIGHWRSRLEAQFTQGLANSPMHGARVRVIGGNFVTARPEGVVDGIDLQAQGRVRRIDHLAIRQHLDDGNIVLLPPLGYSVTGEVFYLAPDHLIIETARRLDADKIVIVGDDPHPITGGQKELTAFELSHCLGQQPKDHPGMRELNTALAASEAGIPRCHVIDGHQDGALLGELFTRDGVGTLIARDRYDTFRVARTDDINGILALLGPLEDKGILVRRSREKLENEIDHFYVNERDGMIIGCAALYPIPETEPSVAELACVAVHPDYRQSGRGDALLRALEKRAREQAVRRLFVLTTQTAHWFAERGFEQAPVGELPPQRQDLYNFQRNSKVYFKTL
ncbi:amino-acid N-acetyltransferase [Saccharospirillum salsuginis]|uniref:Amino-acid acetyltransferase n=1 Tax=Saccharospirillum salsuginis TaxID=418750 RepID=A0A918N8D2_9GAMM|nr:amino-acid N-acetyltransferase [Saccharospirillum salsuginis]GGX46438.1 amino-acid acetyltransferase [Saccharospirillum salsuginis]